MEITKSSPQHSRYYFYLVIITVIKCNSSRCLALARRAVLSEGRCRWCWSVVSNKRNQGKTHDSKNTSHIYNMKSWAERVTAVWTAVCFSFLKCTGLSHCRPNTNIPWRGSGSFHYRYIFIWVINSHLEMDEDGKQGWRIVQFTYCMCVCHHLTYFIYIRWFGCSPRWSLGWSLKCWRMSEK